MSEWMELIVDFEIRYCQLSLTMVDDLASHFKIQWWQNGGD